MLFKITLNFKGKNHLKFSWQISAEFGHLNAKFDEIFELNTQKHSSQNWIFSSVEEGEGLKLGSDQKSIAITILSDGMFRSSEAKTKPFQ